MTRLGSKLPFGQAAEEVWLSQKTEIEESTLRKTTEKYGALAEAIENAASERIEKEAPPSKIHPKQLLISSDGSFIHLKTGEWQEVKTMIVGEFEGKWAAKRGEIEVKTKNISYFSRTYSIRQFEQAALAELHRRGVENATRVVTVNDGSSWIASFGDYHYPQAIAILDFGHAMEYIAEVGRAVWGEDTDKMKQWCTQMAHQLKHDPPQRTLNDLALLASRAKGEEQRAIIDNALRYLQKRQALIDYPHFQSQQLPIGSGSVESSHKLVVQSRMKQAGMRWAAQNVNPMLALRNLVCNGRWSEGWSQIVAYYWQQRHRAFRRRAQAQRPYLAKITFASVSVASVETPLPPPEPSSPPKQPFRPAPDHPWRQGIWPSKESWRWN